MLKKQKATEDLRTWVDKNWGEWGREGVQLVAFWGREDDEI